ncbi:Trans-acting enoyl reductase [Seminavis robusta]|uniref:Trans-acting enoyl reductase n=1 Tax=Seminavis robusta TaxID=568900 RepID=A0A9N8EZS6_9STRA|nr:Trans-acting enoyl reductase [Seminavis robusta]|eukprot:Sro2733_g335790.1 Trans-acting enoyl reductase (421) ;mRNA; f:2805-4067
MSLSAAAASNRPYDLIIYGATGFTGQLAAEYVQKHYPTLKFALAGRNRSKLEVVRKQITTGSSSNNEKEIPLLVADAVQDPKALDELAQSTKVIANYAGSPFVDKALPVVEACAKHGTCYTDITGEPNFQRLSYDRYHKQAKETGALIVHACGYDSIPSDIGAMLAADAMKERHGCTCKSLELVSRGSKGGASGGTIHTGLSMIFGGKTVPGMNEVKARGAYGLDPEGATGGPDTSDTVSFVTYDSVARTYVIPFIMAGANAPVVRKTNALWGYRYGKQCTYREVQAVPSLISGLAGMVGFGLFGVLLAFPPTRWLLTNYVLPKPGEGPSQQARDTGFFSSKIYAVGEQDQLVVAYVKSGTAGDPGYKATAQMSIEASLAMALEREKCATQGGVLTTATALGMTLVDRLNKTGMQLGVEE